MSEGQSEKLNETEVDAVPKASELEKQRKINKTIKTLDVKIKRLGDCNDLPLPEYATSGACAMDLHAAFDEEFTYLDRGDRMLVQTGISIALPEGFEAQIRPRSGLAFKQGISIVNSPGTIDSDYRGPIGVILINHGIDRLKITRGMRIAQMVVQPVTRVTWQEVEDLDETDRGSGGFGHTGH